MAGGRESGSTMTAQITFEIAKPCTEHWSKMQPALGGRHCTHCPRVVHDLSLLTRKQAELLWKNHTAGLCGRIRVDANGAAIFQVERSTASGRLAAALSSLAVAACDAPSSNPPAGRPPEATFPLDSGPIGRERSVSRPAADLLRACAEGHCRPAQPEDIDWEQSARREERGGAALNEREMRHVNGEMRIPPPIRAPKHPKKLKKPNAAGPK